MKTFEQFLAEQQVLVNGGFNIARSQMPQIKDDAAFKKYLEQQSVSVVDTFSMVDFIKPTQIEFDQDRVNAVDLSVDRKIWVSSDDFILDGHHYYFAKLQEAKASKTFMGLFGMISVHRANVGINKLLKLSYDFLEGSNDA